MKPREKVKETLFEAVGGTPAGTAGGTTARAVGRGECLRDNAGARQPAGGSNENHNAFRDPDTLTALTACTSAKPSPITQQDLMRNTQEMFDSVPAGDQTPWKKYFADDSMYFDEKGRSMDKTALVNDITPMPKGYSGASSW